MLLLTENLPPFSWIDIGLAIVGILSVILIWMREPRRDR